MKNIFNNFIKIIWLLFLFNVIVSSTSLNTINVLYSFISKFDFFHLSITIQIIMCIILIVFDCCNNFYNEKKDIILLFRFQICTFICFICVPFTSGTEWLQYFEYSMNEIFYLYLVLYLFCKFIYLTKINPLFFRLKYFIKYLACFIVACICIRINILCLDYNFVCLWIILCCLCIFIFYGEKYFCAKSYIRIIFLYPTLIFIISDLYMFMLFVYWCAGLSSITDVSFMLFINIGFIRLSYLISLLPILFIIAKKYNNKYKNYMFVLIPFLEFKCIIDVVIFRYKFYKKRERHLRFL